MTKAVILTDIEGTTSSTSFVKEVLFSYARREMPRFVRERGNDPRVRGLLDAVAVEHGSMCDDDMIAEVLQGWIDEDRKHTALKALQGILWENGYRCGAFTAHIYPDAAAALRRWRETGHSLAVYSSGSIKAQKLFFGYSSAGDLTHLFSAFFDTQIGHKRDAQSYRSIARALQREPAEILFLSDTVEELDAARNAGARTVLVDRLEDDPNPRNKDTLHGHVRVTSLTEVDI